VSGGALGETFAFLCGVLDVLEENRRMRSLNPMCEPKLGKRGLYKEIGENELAMLWVLNLSDSRHSLLEIAQRSGISFAAIRDASHALTRFKLIR
jgi:aminopeptidase-like protein